MKRFKIFAGIFALAFIAVVSVQVYGQTGISAPQAREIVLGITGGGTVNSLELVSSPTGPVYQIVVTHNATRYEISLNAQTGQIIRLISGQGGGMPQTPGIPRVPQIPQIFAQGGARLDEAAATALARSGGGVVRHVCVDWEQGVAVYHVRIYRNGNRMDYHLDRQSLTVVQERSRSHNNASAFSASYQRRQMDVMPSLTFNQAAAIALAYKGGGSVREVSRSYSGGSAAFDVDITTLNGQKWCFYIDIHTGQILRYHPD